MDTCGKFAFLSQRRERQDQILKALDRAVVARVQLEETRPGFDPGTSVQSGSGWRSNFAGSGKCPGCARIKYQPRVATVLLEAVEGSSEAGVASALIACCCRRIR